MNPARSSSATSPTPSRESLAAMPCYTSSCGRVTLYLGDCLGLLASVEADAIVTDPPYGHSWAGVNSTAKGGRNWTSRRAEKIIGHDVAYDPAPILARDVPTVLWGANHYASRLPDSAAWLVWD